MPVLDNLGTEFKDLFDKVDDIINKSKEMEKEYTKAVSGMITSTAKVNTELGKQGNFLKDLENGIDEITNSTDDLITKEKQLVQVQKGIADAIKIATKQGITDFSKFDKIISKTENSLKDVRKRIKELDKEGLNNTKADIDKITNSGAKAEVQISLLKDAQAKAAKTLKEYVLEGRDLTLIQKQYDLIGDAIDNINVKQDKLNKDTPKGEGGFLGNIKGITGAFKGFLALGVVAKIGEAVASAVQLSKELFNVRNELSQLTGLTGSELSDATAQVSAITVAYPEIDERELTQAANAVSQQLGIGFTDALTSINEQLANGINGNGEYLDSLREYVGFIKEGGGDLEDFNEILQLQNQLGVFSDKGIDAVKEPIIRTREFTKTTEDALKAGFGEGITQEIRVLVNEGNSLEAVKLISKELGNLNTNSKEAGAIIADVFGGAGEDASIEFLTQLQFIGEGFKDTSVEAAKYREEQLRITEANKEFATQQLKLAEALNDSTKDFEILSLNIKTGLLSILVSLAEYFKGTIIPTVNRVASAFGDSTGSVEVATAAFNGLFRGVTFLFDSLNSLVNIVLDINDYFTELGEKSEIARTAFDSFKDAASDILFPLNAIVDTIKGLINAFVDLGKQIKQTFNDVSSFLTTDFSFSGLFKGTLAIPSKFKEVGISAFKAFKGGFDKETETLTKEVNAELDALNETEVRLKAELDTAQTETDKNIIQKQLNELKDKKIKVSIELETESLEARKAELDRQYAALEALGNADGEVGQQILAAYNALEAEITKIAGGATTTNPALITLTKTDAELKADENARKEREKAAKEAQKAKEKAEKDLENRKKKAFDEERRLLAEIEKLKAAKVQQEIKNETDKYKQLQLIRDRDKKAIEQDQLAIIKRAEAQIEVNNLEAPTASEERKIEITASNENLVKLVNESKALLASLSAQVDIDFDIDVSKLESNELSRRIALLGVDADIEPIELPVTILDFTNQLNANSLQDYTNNISELLAQADTKIAEGVNVEAFTLQREKLLKLRQEAIEKEAELDKQAIDNKLNSFQAIADAQIQAVKLTDEYYDEQGKLTKEGEAEIIKANLAAVNQRANLIATLLELNKGGAIDLEALGFDVEALQKELNTLKINGKEINFDLKLNGASQAEEKLKEIESLIQGSFEVLSSVTSGLNNLDLGIDFSPIDGAIPKIQGLITKLQELKQSGDVGGAIAAQIAIASAAIGAGLEIASSAIKARLDDARADLDAIDAELESRSADLASQLKEERERQEEGYNNQVALIESIQEKNRDSADLENLTTEELQERREKALAEEKKRQKEFLAIQVALQAANAITAVTALIANGASKGVIGLGIAAAAIPLIFAVIAAARGQASEFYEGGYTGDGNPRAVSTALGERPGITYHQGEYIIPHKPTKRNRTLLEGIHKGDRAKIETGIETLAKQYNIELTPDTRTLDFTGITNRINSGEIAVKHTIVSDLKSSNEELKKELKGLRKEVAKVTANTGKTVGYVTDSEGTKAIETSGNSRTITVIDKLPKNKKTSV